VYASNDSVRREGYDVEREEESGERERRVIKKRKDRSTQIELFVFGGKEEKRVVTARRQPSNTGHARAPV
jgi:hypothetical protein